MSIRVRSTGRSDDPGSTILADGDRRFAWLGRLQRGVSNALGLTADPVGFVLELPSEVGKAGQDVLIQRLVSSAEPERLTSVLNEAVSLLDQADRGVIAARLSGEEPSAVASRIGVTIDEVGPLYARVVDRLVERLAWVISQEALGISPPERKVLGQARFLGKSAQEIAQLFGLPLEVVQRWLREAGNSVQVEPRIAE
jgi:hypothetical protein